MIKIKNKKVVFSVILLSFILFGGKMVYAYLEDREIEAIQAKYAQPYQHYIKYEFDDLEYIKSLIYELVEAVNNSDARCMEISFELEKACEDFINKDHTPIEEEILLRDTHDDVIEAVTLVQDSCLILYNTYQIITLNDSVNIDNIEAINTSSSLINEGSTKLFDLMNEIQSRTN